MFKNQLILRSNQKKIFRKEQIYALIYWEADFKTKSSVRSNQFKIFFLLCINGSFFIYLFFLYDLIPVDLVFVTHLESFTFTLLYDESKTSVLFFFIFLERIVTRI